MPPSNPAGTEGVALAVAPLPYPVDGLVAYGFSCAAVRDHRQYEQQCTTKLTALAQQQSAALGLTSPSSDEVEPVDPVVLLRRVPAQSEVAQLAAELVSHRYFWSSLRPVQQKPTRERYLRATLTKPKVTASDVSTSHTAPLSGSAFSASVTSTFGSLPALYQQLVVLARSLHGSGWLWLVWDHQEQRLQLLLETGTCCPLAVPLAQAQTETASREPLPVTVSATPSRVSRLPSAQTTRSATPTSRVPSLSSIGAAAVVQVRHAGPAAARALTRLGAALSPRASSPKKTKTSAPRRPPQTTPVSPTTDATKSAPAPDAEKKTSAVASAVKAPVATPSPAPATATPAAVQTAGAAWKPRYAALFACDLWEHAYLRDFGLARDTYVACFWSALNWGVIEERFTKATQGSAASVKVSTSKL